MSDSARRLIDLTDADLANLVDQRLAAHIGTIVSPANELLDRNGAAKFLNVSLPQLDKLIRSTALPYHWLGESKRFDRDELLNWVKSSDAGKARGHSLRRAGA